MKGRELGGKYRDDRFWAKVEKSGDGCWSWTANRDRDGYGLFWVTASTPSGGTTVRPHRLAYERLVGPIPSGMHLDHLCKNRRCVNPAHLQPVTPRENVHRSGTLGGTWNRGEACGTAKLTQDQVDHIRVLIGTGVIQQQTIAAAFGVSKMTISNIKNGRTWVHA